MCGCGAPESPYWSFFRIPTDFRFAYVVVDCCVSRPSRSGRAGGRRPAPKAYKVPQGVKSQKPDFGNARFGIGEFPKLGEIRNSFCYWCWSDGRPRARRIGSRSAYCRYRDCDVRDTAAGRGADHELAARRGFSQRLLEAAGACPPGGAACSTATRTWRRETTAMPGHAPGGLPETSCLVAGWQGAIPGS